MSQAGHVRSSTTSTRGAAPAERESRTGHSIDALSAAGQVVHLRPADAADAVRLHELYEKASPRSRYLRFFSLGTSQIDDEVARLTRPQSAHHTGVVAERDGQLIGVASYERLSDERAESPN
ncbi:MAG: hypothetical protein WCA46_10170 [Actinocatenispora sp.]